MIWYDHNYNPRNELFLQVKFQYMCCEINCSYFALLYCPHVGDVTLGFHCLLVNVFVSLLANPNMYETINTHILWAHPAIHIFSGVIQQYIFSETTLSILIIHKGIKTYVHLWCLLHGLWLLYIEFSLPSYMLSDFVWRILPYLLNSLTDYSYHKVRYHLYLKFGL